MLSIDQSTRFRPQARSPDSNHTSPSVAVDRPQAPRLPNAPRPALWSSTFPQRQNAGRSSTHSIFMDVLTAFYAPPPLTPQSNPRTVNRPSAQVPAGLGKKPSSEMIKWTRKPPVDDSDSEDEQRRGAPSPFAGFPSELLQKALYSPTGRWEWADGLPIVNSQTLLKLGTGAMCSATLKKGQLGDRTITYISRCWPLSKRMLWRGFHSELALYKSNDYLRSQQGDIIPNLIAVCMNPISVTLVMEPPHHSFWIEASPDMPVVLKERVIAAYEKLHARGLLHGDAELRHMLIGADAKVTLIDFQESRARVPNVDLMLYQATPEDFAFEMRRVKFKLDYDGAREREGAKMERANQRAARVRSRRPRRIVKGQPVPADIVEADVPLLEEDIREPPVPVDVWNDQWVPAAHTQPQRTIVPGQTTEQVAEAVRGLLTAIRRMEDEKAARLHFDHTFFAMQASGPAPSQEPSSSPTAGESASPSKRLPQSSYTRVVSSGPKSFEATTYVGWDDGELLPASTSSSDPPKPVHAHDYATQPYEGLRGFYVPHPPTENRMSMERVKYIRQNNANECADLGYKYWTFDLPNCKPPSYKRSVPSGTHIAKGILKRMRGKTAGEEEEGDGEDESPPPKKPRYVGRSMNGHYAGSMHRWEAKEVLDLSGRPGAPRPYQPSAPRPAFPFTPSRRMRPVRGILRQTPAVKPVSYEAKDWEDEADVMLSPKVGPDFKKLPLWSTQALLHTWVDRTQLPRKRLPPSSNPPQTPRGSPRRSASPASSRGVDAGWSVALAALAPSRGQSPASSSRASSASPSFPSWTPPTPPRPVAGPSSRRSGSVAPGPSLQRSGSVSPGPSLERSSLPTLHRSVHSGLVAPGPSSHRSVLPTLRRSGSAAPQQTSFHTVAAGAQQQVPLPMPFHRVRYTKSKSKKRGKPVPPPHWSDSDSEADEQEVEALVQCSIARVEPTPYVGKRRSGLFWTVFGGWWA
ncbi:hypothetical protein B0H21DRAFT_742605 [Amylocystis lapponica]|nr:hypothetical protein B0H21DRAFT_742605 [Amylocystis lapponica]